MYLVLFVLEAFVVARATALPQEIDNDNLLNQDQLSQDQPYQDQVVAGYPTDTVPAQDVSTSDDSGIQNYVGFLPDNLDISSTTTKVTSSADNLRGLNELAAVSNPIRDSFDGQNSLDRIPAKPQENFAGTSDLDASALGTFSDAALPYCDDAEKSEIPAEDLNNLISRGENADPDCGPDRWPTCCEKKLQKDGTVQRCLHYWSDLDCHFFNPYCCKDVVNGAGVDCIEIPPQPTSTKKPNPRGPKVPWFVPWPQPAPEPAPAYQKTPAQLCRPRHPSPPRA